MIEEWLHYFTRMFHLIAGIMWIGTSFYFVWLDGSFQPLPDKKEGIEGETYMVHGGFFYRVEKQRPTVMPRILHWFKYEALLTWISGVFLLGLVYWTNGGLALIDTTRFAMSPAMAIGMSVGSLALAWIVYDLLWMFVGGRAPNVALGLSISMLLGAIYGLCYVFPGRAAFIHVGAVLGTVMIANVWMRILPNQRRMIAASLAGKEPDWARGAAAKQRSLHNSYVTIPVLITMVSNHFSFVFDHELNWVILSILCVIGASTRHLMITAEKEKPAYWTLAPGLIGLASVVWLTLPVTRPADTSPPVPYAEVSQIIARRCSQCHSSTPTDSLFTSPPNGVTFDSPSNVHALAARIRLRAVEARTMPLANRSEMTDEERVILGRWVDQGARIQ